MSPILEYYIIHGRTFPPITCLFCLFPFSTKGLISVLFWCFTVFQHLLFPLVHQTNYFLFLLKPILCVQMPSFPWTKKKNTASEDDVVESGMTIKQIMQEREEYVKNIGIEYRFGCYEEKRADSCQLLGEYFEAVQTDFASAFDIFRENCEQRKFPRSCFKYGQYLAGGRSCEASFKKAIAPLKVSCEGGIAKGCRVLALIFWNAEADRPSDSVQAEQMMKRAAELGDYEASWTLSTWYFGDSLKYERERNAPYGRKMGELPRDMQKALMYGLKACDEGDIYQSCVNVSLMYRNGDGIPKDEKKAKQYQARARELHNMIKKGWNAGFTA